MSADLRNTQSWHLALTVRQVLCSITLCLWCAVSYVDDCRDDDGTATHLIGESGGHLAVFPRHLPASHRCPWTLTVTAGRRINITWRVFPTPVRYIPPGVPLPLGGGLTIGTDSPPCSLKLTFIEPGHQPISWICRDRGQDVTSFDHATQVATIHKFLLFFAVTLYSHFTALAVGCL